MKSLTCVIVLFIFFICGCSSNDSPLDSNPIDDVLYFPPFNSDSWDTISISDLNWNESELQPLLDYLEDKNTKGFVILYNGKIVLGTETYFNGHAVNSNWYWASAGKTLTSTVVGIAQQEQYLNINDKVSNYLGVGWTSAALEKENLITCKNLLSMNSGLDDSLGDDVSPDNLQYIADAGERWAYHNVYVKLQNVVANATNNSWINYFNEKLKEPIGMTGSWLPSGDLSVYWSNTRSMARFGLMIYAKGKWNDNTIIDEAFLEEATNISQNINEAYGYLWWLNGKTSFHLPGLQFEFNGELIPNAPDDMYAALGKNDQKIYVVPSEKLVIVRMGEVANLDNPTFGLSGFDNEFWSKINALINE